MSIIKAAALCVGHQSENDVTHVMDAPFPSTNALAHKMTKAVPKLMCKLFTIGINVPYL
jgi:hypothetical protein